MTFTFVPNDKVTFDLDEDNEILIVKSSGFFRTACVTLDGIEVSYATSQLSYAQIPAAI